MRFLPSLRSDIPFSRDDANRFLPWIVAMMVGLTALLVCVGLSLQQSLSARHASISEQVTVQIPAESSGEERVAQARKALEEAGVMDVKIIKESEVRAMVSPWLGDDELASLLPLPVVMHASLAPGGKADLKALEEALHAISPDIALDQHTLWAEKFSRFSRTLQLGLYTLALLLIATLSAMIVFTAREAMKLHRRTVLLLHAIGADDRYIARQFQANALNVAIRGAVVGTLAASALFAAGSWYTQRLDAPLLPNFAFTSGHALALLALLPLSGLLAFLSARLAVLAQLKALP